MKKNNCPLCDEEFNDLTGMGVHIEDEHSDNIPEGYTVQRYLYFIKTGKTHGSCVMCKSDTGWNDSTGKYKRFCENPKCKEAYREMFKKRMVGKYGKTTLLNDPEQQRKMLAHRHISGEYEWTDGSKKTYTGSYELDFLKMLDVFMNFDSSDVMTPSPHTYYYIYEGEKKFYIPDVFIPSLNLEIEIKDGGDNPNMHGKIVAVDKVKEKLKDDVMYSQKQYDYIKIVNKNYDNFFKYLLSKKEETANAKNIPLTGIIRESASVLTEGSHDAKAMCANAPIETSPELTDILNNVINSGNNIWIATDWHLWRYDKEKCEIYKKPNFNDILNNCTSIVGENDALIYLGDLTDDEFTDKYALRDTIQKLPGIKILVKGNNDLFDDAFYKSCGFVYVGYKFLWEGIVFSHIPTENDQRLNIHGHSHGSMIYWINYTNQIDVYREDGRPVNIMTVIKSRNRYSKNIIRVTEPLKQKGKHNAEKYVFESYEPVVEASSKLRDVDDYYEFDRFVNGDSNILFITGLSGSNKTTLARDMSQQFNSEYINLDILTPTTLEHILDGQYVGSGSKDYISIVSDYVNRHLTFDSFAPPKLAPLTDDQIVGFIKTLMSKLKPNKRYIIEGIYIYRYYDKMASIIDKYPLVISRQNFKENLKLIAQSSVSNMSNIFNIIYDDTTNDVQTWLRHEKQKLDEFVIKCGEVRNQLLTASRYTQPYYPVFVLLIHSGTMLANVIKKFTGDEFSHASISFDPSLRALYSFASDYTDGSLMPGFVHEDITASFLHRPIPYALYATMVPKSEFIQMKQKLYDIAQHGNEYKYSVPGLVKYALGMNAETRGQLFCSEFVSTILNAKTNRTDGLRASEVKPETFKTLSKFQLIQKGVLTEYDVNTTIERVRRMKRK